MLTNIPKGINRATRNTVVRHPNSYNCQLFRQIVNRVSDSEVGGLPTMGGLGVLSSDDEEDISWDFVGNGYALQVGNFVASQMMDRQDANNGFEEEFRFLIEPESIDSFAPKNSDVLYLLITETVKIAFEIVAIETTSNIPPFTQRYVCNKRANLDMP